MLTDAAAAGLIDFDETFQRLAETKFRLGNAVVEELKKRLREASDTGEY